MKNIHTVYCDWDKSKMKILEKFGIKVECGFNKLVLEENETFFQVKAFLETWKANDYVISKFSEEEENNATRLILLSPWANGYPMPDSNFGYKKTTYNDAEHCKTCGMGLVQKEPFRLKKEPNWSGNKKMFSLNWVYDEFFLQNSFYNEVFNDKGIKSEIVLLFKKETVIKSTIQLTIPITEVDLDLEGYSYEICKECNRKKYNLVNEGFFPAFKENVKGLHLFKCKEWFGTGANARRYIFISKELRQELLKSKVTASYIPQQDK